LRYAAALSPLAGSLTGRHSRAALCEAVSALAARLPALAPTAELLASLNAMSATSVRLSRRSLGFKLCNQRIGRF